MVGEKLSPKTFIKNPEPYEAVTKSNRGTYCERELISLIVKEGFKPTAIYHDLIIEKGNGKTVQIDIVLATKAGLIVIEVKDYSGWIFGKGNQDIWTQVTRYGRQKNRFYNPFKQNEGHIRALRQLSKQMATIPMYSLVVFGDDCELKDVSFIPQNNYLATFYHSIEAIYDIIETHPPANYTDQWEIANLLKAAVNLGENTKIQEEHIDNIHDMLGTNRKYI